MRYILENDSLSVEVDSFGAEIKSVKRKSDGREYMWCGDKKYWGRTSPVLFPFVGSVNKKEYRYEGKTYSMNQHGFARDCEHTLELRTKDTIWFSLRETEETRKVYPFRFVLKIGYELKDNEVKVLWRVENPDTKTLQFSIGAHPAFNCPIHGEESKTGYGLKFEGAEQLFHYGNTEDGEAMPQEKLELSLQEGKVRFTPEFFDRCTYMVADRQTSEVSLLDRKQQPYVTVSFDAPLFALWSPEKKDAPFVCIEPWFGRADAVGFDGSLEERPYNNTLAGGEAFDAAYQMKFQ